MREGWWEKETEGGSEGLREGGMVEERQREGGMVGERDRGKE